MATSRLVIRLVGGRDREAVGAVVTAVVRDERINGFRLTGNGYLVTNEPCILLAIPAGVESVDLEISWPSGHTDRLPTIALTRATRELMVCEGVPLLFWGPTRDRVEQ